ncbi:hypothetical protein J2T13_001362 [Paenibacillus sp. DS2015]|uniref:hypothetical protein n=1 Tax=Paenibacillus sp. DS2015 TaxID=3373917 RepID=UPI003D1F9E6C
MNVSNQEQKRVRLKQFLKILSEDPYLLNQDGLEKLRSLSEIVILTGYKSRDGLVNMAELVSLLLKKMGIEAGSEDLMECVMEGGSVDNFMTQRNKR